MSSNPEPLSSESDGGVVGGELRSTADGGDDGMAEPSLPRRRLG
jgi:hypothetical protein